LTFKKKLTFSISYFNLQLRNGRNPLDLIAPGSKLECQDFRDSLSTWLVTVVENIGGRLKLRYEGLESRDGFEHWLYYLDPFLHHIGWAAQQGCDLQPPLGKEEKRFPINFYDCFLLIPMRLKCILYIMKTFLNSHKVFHIYTKYKCTYLFDFVITLII
jgi:hypothetical protein